MYQILTKQVYSKNSFQFKICPNLQKGNVLIFFLAVIRQMCAGQSGRMYFNSQNVSNHSIFLRSRCILQVILSVCNIFLPCFSQFLILFSNTIFTLSLAVISELCDSRRRRKTPQKDIYQTIKQVFRIHQGMKELQLLALMCCNCLLRFQIPCYHSMNGKQ